MEKTDNKDNKKCGNSIVKIKAKNLTKFHEKLHNYY